MALRSPSVPGPLTSFRQSTVMGVPGPKGDPGIGAPLSTGLLYDTVGVVSAIANGTAGFLLTMVGGSPTWTAPASTTPTGPAGGDLSGTYPNPGVAQIQGQPVTAGAPTKGQYLISTPAGTWAPVSVTGDVTPSVTTAGLTKVTGLQSAALPALPGGDQYLHYTGAVWAFTALPAALPPNGPAGGDLSGTYPNPGVAAILGAAVPSLPGTDKYLHYTGAVWAFTALPAALPPSGPAGGDLSGTYPNPGVAKIQGQAVTAGAPTKGQYLISTPAGTWAPVSVTGDVTPSVTTAGLTTVTGAQGAALPALPGTDQYLHYTGAAWSFTALPAALPPNGPAGGDLSGTYPNPGVAKIQGQAVTAGAPTKGQYLISTPAGTWAPVSVTGDVTPSVTTAGFTTVTGAQGAALPALPGTDQYLHYTGAAWSFTALPAASPLTAYGADLVNSAATLQYVSALSFNSTGAAGAGGAIAVKGTSTVLNWLNNVVTLNWTGTTVLSAGLNAADFLLLGASTATAKLIPTSLMFGATSATPTLSINTQVSDALTNDLLITGQTSFASATGANQKGGNVTITPGAGGGTNAATGNINFVLPVVAGTGVRGLIQLKYGSQISFAAGPWDPAQPTNYQAIWLINSGTPTTSNHSFISNGSTTILNAATTMAIGIAGGNYHYAQNVNGIQLMRETAAIDLAGGVNVVGLTDCTTAPAGGTIASGTVLYSELGAMSVMGAFDTHVRLTPVESGSANTQQKKVPLLFVKYARIAASGSTTTLNIPLATAATCCKLTVSALMKIATAGTINAVGDTYVDTKIATFKNVGGTVTQVGASVDLTTSQADTSLNTSTITFTISTTNIVVTLTANATAGTLGNADCTIYVEQVVN
jgi:hypothetical protein